MRWATHLHFPDYLVSENCDVIRAGDSKRGHKKGDVVRGAATPRGYRQFKLRNAEGKKTFIRANRLIAEVFIGPAPSPKHHAAHYDGDRLNNRIDNIRWATAKENIADSIRHGTLPRGERVGTSRLTAEFVQQLRHEYTGRRGSLAHLARKHGVSHSHVCRIIYGESWQHVDRPGESALERK
jgi:hypothetical protein